MRRLYLSFISVLFVFRIVRGQSPKPCRQDEFHYVYTECDKNNHRWKVAVPNSTCVGNLPMPTPGKDCKFACKEGAYLDVKSETCRECPAGTFSLGGGYVFEDFASIPSEFIVTTERDSPSQYYSESNTPYAGDYNCDKTGWTVVNGDLIYIPSPCLSTLSYSVNLVRPGNITFTYLYPDGEVVFAFSVQNAQCVIDNDRQGGYLSTTHEGKWKTKSISLNKGQTLLTWKAFAYSGQYQPILVKKIEIIGIAYTQQCTQCPNGTYSSGNSKSCTPCLPGSYSERGAMKCADCDGKTSYSGFRATSCIKRPACNEFDFVKYYSPCNEQSQTTVSYKWLDPKICREDVPNAVNIKNDVTTVACKKCNPGMELVKSACKYCSKNFYSDGTTACQQCPSGTAPNYGYQFVTWHSLPDVLQRECRQTEDTAPECKNVTSWVLAGDHIHTAYVRRQDVYFALTLSVDGFQNLFLHGEPSDTNPIGHVSFVFETKCVGPDCSFYCLQTEDPLNGFPDILAQWNGTVKKQAFRFPITTTQSTQFTWLFVRGQFSQKNDYDQEWLKDSVSIYLINVTNVKNVGASACIPCPISDKKECTPCPPGHYVNTEDRKCMLCQNGTYLNISSSIGVESCVKCGPNLISDKGVECDTDCRFNISGKSFDLSPLKNFYQAKGVQIFNRDIRYYHIFNFSVCSNDKVSCSNTISDFVKYGTEVDSISSLVCRVVAVPQGSSTYFHGPLEIGDHLVGVLDNLSFPDFEIPRNVVAPWRYSELYFLYRSVGRTSSCPNGRSSLIVFRCDPGQNKTHVELPQACPDSTCDGCLFQIIVTSKYACPLCTKNDYSEVVGECHLGSQTIHYIPKKVCVLAGEDQLKTKTQKCEILTFEVEVIIAIASFVALILLYLVIYVWKKNQKLEYKYMKLVESAAGKDGELPGVESCALHDDDDEEEGSDRVVFSKGGKRTGWFSGRSNKMKERGQGAENNALTLGGEMDES